jgi:predicted nucleic acid-binding protein
VILVDTSAWIEFLRATGSGVHLEIRRLLGDGAELWTTDVVVMEVLAGARDDAHLVRLRRLLGRCHHAPLEGLDDYESAAALFRECRRAGETVRALADCLIAVVALRAELAVLHADRDFDALARRCGLRTQQAP